MSKGWEAFGTTLGGDSELEYEQGRAIGAKTEDALASARERVNKNAARQQSEQTFIDAGVPPAKAKLLANSVLGEYDLGQQFGGLLKQQEYGLRERASNPELPFDQRQIALQGVSPGPVERFATVGKGHYQDKFSNADPIDLGGAFGGGEGGDAAGIQMLRAFGFLTPDGRVAPGREADAFDLYRDTTRNVDVGGVPVQTFNNPFRRGGPAPVAPPAAPGAMPAAAPPAAAPVPPAVQRTPVAGVNEVAANTAAVNAAKEVGQARGKAQAGLPDALADIDKMEKSIDAFTTMPGFNGAYGNLQGTAAGSIISGTVSQDIKDAQIALENIGAQAFGVGIQKMIGLGQLSNAEGSRVIAAYTRALNPGLGEIEARKAWAEVKDGLALARQRAYQKAGQGPGAPADAAPAPGGVISLDEYLRSKGH